MGEEESDVAGRDSRSQRRQPQPHQLRPPSIGLPAVEAAEEEEDETGHSERAGQARSEDSLETKGGRLGEESLAVEEIGLAEEKRSDVGANEGSAGGSLRCEGIGEMGVARAEESVDRVLIGGVEAFVAFGRDEEKTGE